jgi:hypothetical protein
MMKLEKSKVLALSNEIVTALLPVVGKVEKAEFFFAFGMAAGAISLSTDDSAECLGALMEGLGACLEANDAKDSEGHPMRVEREAPTCTCPRCLTERFFTNGSVH